MVGWWFSVVSFAGVAFSLSRRWVVWAAPEVGVGSFGGFFRGVCAISLSGVGGVGGS